jgi:hypothetical protein
MQVYIFISESEPSVRAFTADQTGANLPVEYAPWRAANGGNPMRIASGSDTVARAVAEGGFYLVSSKEQKRHGRSFN